MKLYKDRYFLTLSILALLASLILYYITKAPTLSFWDCGEFIAASYIMGIPHPPGYPMYIILGRFFSLLPISGDIAVRVNLLSVFGASASVFVAYWLILRVALARKEEIPQGLPRIGLGIGAFCGAIIMGFSYTFWSGAVEAEVYTLSMFLMLLINYVAFSWSTNTEKKGNDRLLILISYLLWLSLGIHMTTFIIIIPTIVYLVYVDYTKCRFVHWPVWIVMALFVSYAIPLHIQILRLIGVDISNYELNIFTVFFVAALLMTSAVALTKRRKQSHNSSAWVVAAMVMIFAAIGYSSQSYIPIRAAKNPSINENNPSNWARFKGFLERKQYGQESMITRQFKRRGSWENQFVSHPRFGLLRYFNLQYASPDSKFTLYRSSQANGKNGATDFSLSLPMLYILILGLLGVYESIRRAPPEGLFLLFTFLLCTAGLVIYMNFSDGAYNTAIAPQAEVRNRDYFYTPGFMYYGIIIGLGLATILEWLGRKAAGVNSRKGVLKGVFVLAGSVAVLISANTVSANFELNDRRGNYLPWNYARNILQSCEENAILFTNGDNDTFPLWYVQQVEGFRTDVRVANLSLLNTPWYIHQLKDSMNLPITLEDNIIDHLQPVRIPDNDRIWRVQDQMVQHIVTNIQKDGWEIPVYFAITVSDENRLGLDDHLIMEGMTYRIVESSGKDRVNTAVGMKIFGNPDNFRGISDPTVAKDENDQRLAANYMVAIFRLAEGYYGKNQPDSAIYLADLAGNLLWEAMPWQSRAYLSRIYARGGRLDRVVELAQGSPDEEKVLLAVTQDLIMNGQFDFASRLLETTLGRYPSSFAAFNNLAVLYYRNGDTLAVDSLIDGFRRDNGEDIQLLSSVDQLMDNLKNLPPIARGKQ